MILLDKEIEQQSWIAKQPLANHSLENSLLKTLNQNKKAEHFVWLLRHGLTIANMEKDMRKEADEPLIESEFWPKSSIKKQANNFLQLWIPIQELCIHFDPIVKRDWQTAKIFCEEIWLTFPNEKEMFDTHIMKEKYPHLKLTRALATRKKWDRQNNEIPIQWTKKNEAWAESILESRVRIFDYIEKIKKNIQNNSYKHHIMIGHRTGTNGFLDAKYNRSKIDLIKDMKESEVSQLDYGFLNQTWEFINLTKQPYSKQWEIKVHNENKVFEFDISLYPQQVEEFKSAVSTLNILLGNNIIADTNIMNAYLEEIKENISNDMSMENIFNYIGINSNFIRTYILSFLVDIIISSKDKNIENIVVEYLDDEGVPEKEKCRWMLKLYNNKHEFWKYVLYKLYMKNKNIIANPIISQFIEEDRKTLIPSPDGRLIPKTPIEQEIEKINQTQKYNNIHIDTLLWNNIFLKDFYVTQNLSWEGENLSSNDLIDNILHENNQLFIIQATGWSGKTILSKYLLMNLSNFSHLQKNNTYSTRVKEVDLNDYSVDTLENILQWPENIFVIDALDEKNPNTVKKLAEISNSDKFKHSNKKLILLWRYVDDDFVYKNDEKTEKKENVVLYQLQEEVAISDYIQSFTKIIKPEHIQEKFKKELTDIVDVLDSELKTPIIIEMLANIVKRKISVWRGGKVFVDKNGNEKKDITRKDIYDKFFEYLHQREGQKSDNFWEENERLYLNNPFMGEEYDELRKDFLSFASNNIFLYNQKNLKNGIVISKWDLHAEMLRFLFTDLFDGGMLQTDAYIKYKKHFDVHDMKLEDFLDFMTTKRETHKTYQMINKKIDIFLETLFAYGFFKNEWDNKISFYHKSFLEYFNYINYSHTFTDTQKYIEYIAKIAYFFDDMPEKIAIFLSIPWFEDSNNMIKVLDKFKKNKDKEIRYPHEKEYRANVYNKALLSVFGNRKVSYKDIQSIWKIHDFVKKVFDGKEKDIISSIEKVKMALKDKELIEQFPFNKEGLEQTLIQLNVWLKIIQDIQREIQEGDDNKDIQEHLNELWSLCKKKKICFTREGEWNFINTMLSGLDTLYRHSLKDILLMLNWDYLAHIKYQQEYK